MELSKQYNSEYSEWLSGLKNKIRTTQLKAALSANSEVIGLYWELGKEIYEKQEISRWGNAVVDSLAADLKSEFPSLGGFSRRNLFYMKSFYLFYKNYFEKVQQLVAQIPWGNNIVIFSKSRDINSLVSQNVILSKRQLGGAIPFTFTERGVAMLSSILKTQTA